MKVILGLHILSALIIIAGTWRAAQGVIASPGLFDMIWVKNHHWLSNLIHLPKKIVLWFFHKAPEAGLKSASINSREVFCGLRWLVIGILIQLALQIYGVIYCN